MEEKLRGYKTTGGDLDPEDFPRKDESWELEAGDIVEGLEKQIADAEKKESNPFSALGLYCVYHPKKLAKNALQVQGQGNLLVCRDCNVALISKNKDYRCQYCGVPTKIKHWRRDALEGFHHEPKCPIATDRKRVENA